MVRGGCGLPAEERGTTTTVLLASLIGVAFCQAKHYEGEFMIYSIKYTDDMPDTFGGYTRLWFVKIRPKYKDDVGLHKHGNIGIG